jgi:hypothetical protein
VTAPERPGPTSRDVFVAREPIFDRQSGLFGYELLFRSGPDNWFDGQDPDQASLSVIASSFFVFGIEALTGPGRAFINFTRSTLLSDCAYVLPRERLVVAQCLRTWPEVQSKATQTSPNARRSAALAAGVGTSQVCGPQIERGRWKGLVNEAHAAGKCRI